MCTLCPGGPLLCDHCPRNAGSQRYHQSSGIVIGAHQAQLRGDVVDEKHPLGVRLTTMLHKLEEFFSTRGLLKGNGFVGRWLRIRASVAAGSDVLVFFDFMSIPQVGKDASGDPIPRTQGEERLFLEVLPNMSTLYDTFTVCVLPDVVEGVHPYQDSGSVFQRGGRCNAGQTVVVFLAGVQSLEWEGKSQGLDDID